MPTLKNFCTGHWVGPRKCASNRARNLLRSALPMARKKDPAHQAKSSGPQPLFKLQ